MNKTDLQANNPQFHPSQFENSRSESIKSNLTERSKQIFSKNLDKLSSPGKYNLTPNDDGLDISNTKNLFKNLYGETLLTFLFFSQDNINNIQKLIRMTVYKEMNKVIDDQSINDLMVIMRSIFLSYSEHPKLIDSSMSEKEKKHLLILYTNEVDRLNNLVINECVPLVSSQLQQYLTYLHDASSPLQVMEKPISTSVTGTKSFRSQTQILLGGNL